MSLNQSSSDLHHLVYVSKSNLLGEARELAKELETIISTAQTNNLRRGITGALMFSDGYFAQVLEGPLQTIQGAFQRIRGDSRHQQVVEILCEPIESRQFADWTMSVGSVTEPDDVSLLARAHAQDVTQAWSGVGHDLIDTIHQGVPENMGFS